METMAGGISGTVKSWNGNKGFGFIEGSVMETDVMFSRNELPEECKNVHGKFLCGRAVTFQASQGPDGRYKATSVSVPYAEGWPVAGRIKSYSEKHGYGFIVSNQLTQDVRFDRNAIDAAPGAGLVGQLVVVELAPRPDGKLNAGRVLFQDTTFSARSNLAGNPPASPGAFPNGRGGADGLNSMVGVVKMFNFRSGTGYLTVSGYAGDVVFNATDPNILVGGMVSFSPLSASDGRLWANNVSPIPSMGSMGGPISVAKRPLPSTNGAGAKKQRTEISTGQYASGSVKNYNERKGFGFIACDGLADDIFFMRTWLPAEFREATGSDLTGTSVNFELLKTQDGKYRAQNITLAG